MNEFNHLQDYSVTSVPLRAPSPWRPAPRRSAHGRTARKALAAGLRRLGDRLDG